MADALRDELLSVPGIAGAEVESDEGIAGVRVQLAEGADADAVGLAVRRILSDHGMRPAPVEPGEEGLGPPPPPGAPGSVVSFPLVGEHAKSHKAGAAAMVGEAALEGVGVEETPQGISVSVRCSDGRSADRVLDESGIEGMDEAIVGAVAALLDIDQVLLVRVSEVALGEHKVVTVLLSAGEKSLTGSAILRGGRAYATARATWIALSQTG